MTPLDDLPAEQRAVLELVLKRGRTYDEIAALLSIDRAGVRQRALTGLDALGPSTSVPPERRALITDYLLGQLPERVSEQVAQRLATEASDRAWARVIASELSPVAATPLPRIPTGADLQDAELQEAEPEGPEPDDNDYARSTVEPRPAGVAETAASGGGRAPPAGAPDGAPQLAPRRRDPARPRRGHRRRDRDSRPRAQLGLEQVADHELNRGIGSARDQHTAGAAATTGNGHRHDRDHPAEPGHGQAQPGHARQQSPGRGRGV